MSKRSVSEEKNERWRFHISIKLEKTDVSSARSSKGCRVSNDAMIGLRKCYSELRSAHILPTTETQAADRIYQLQTINVRPLSFVKFVNYLESLSFPSVIHLQFASPVPPFL